MSPHDPASPAVAPLLETDEPPAVSVLNAEGQAPVLLVCDHASNGVPRRLGRLGLPDQDFQRHIAWDIGSAGVTRRLAALLDAPAVLAGYSRLVIDCNRQPGDPTSIPEISDGTAVPGNFGLAEDAAESRVEGLFWPYHHSIGNMIAHLWRHGPAPAVVAIHSFTPVMNCIARPWHVGVLWNRDPRMALPLLESLRARDDLCVGDNQPYSGREIGYTVDTHAGAAGLPHVSVEIRQDLIADDAGIERWAGLMAQELRPILATAGLHRVLHF